MDISVVNLLIYSIEPCFQLNFISFVICIMSISLRKPVSVQVMLPWNCSQASGSCWACFAFSGVMGLSANRQRLFQEQRRGEEILHVNKWMRFLSFLQGSKKAKEETQYSVFWKVKTAYVFRGLRVGNGSLLSF